MQRLIFSEDHLCNRTNGPTLKKPRAPQRLPQTGSFQNWLFSTFLKKTEALLMLSAAVSMSVLESHF